MVQFIRGLISLTGFWRKCALESPRPKRQCQVGAGRTVPLSVAALRLLALVARSEQPGYDGVTPPGPSTNCAVFPREGKGGHNKNPGCRRHTCRQTLKHVK